MFMCMTTLPLEIVELIMSFVQHDEFVILKSSRTTYIKFRNSWIPKQCLRRAVKDYKRWRANLGCYSGRGTQRDET